MQRRLFALITILGLLAGLFALPAAPTLVCRMTGKPMEPVVFSPQTVRSCCMVTQSLTADGASKLTLAQPGCCDVRQAAAHQTPPATVAADPDFSVVAWLPTPLIVPVTSPTLSMTPPSIAGSAGPRAPPRSGLSSRAPPILS